MFQTPPQYHPLRSYCVGLPDAYCSQDGSTGTAYQRRSDPVYTLVALRGAAVGLLSLLRNEGGSVGTSLAQTMQERRDQFHSLRLGESLDPFNAAAHSFLDQAAAPFLQQTGDPVTAQQLALQALANVCQQQASALAYFDVFWVLAVVMVALVFVVLLMKRSVAEKGTRIGAE